MLKFWLFALLVGLLWYFVYNILDLIFLVIGAYIISMIVESLVLWLEKFKLWRWLSIILAYIVFVLFLFWLIIFVLPFLLDQVVQLVSIWLSHISWFQELLTTKWLGDIVANTNLPWFIKEYFHNYLWNTELLWEIQATLQQNLSQIVAVWKEYIQIFGTVVVDFVAWFASMAIDFTLFITMAILFSLEKESMMSFVARLSWKENYDLTYMKMEIIYKKLAIWLKARGLLSIFITLAVWIWLLVLSLFWIDFPNKFWLALLAWLLDVIPYIWPFIFGLLLFVISMIYNTLFVSLLAVWILFGINLLENNALVPILMNKTLWVSPILIMLTMVVWGMIMWFLWILLAVPIAVIITLFFQTEKELVADNNKDDENIFKSLVSHNWEQNKDKLKESKKILTKKIFKKPQNKKTQNKKTKTSVKKTAVKRVVKSNKK